MYDLVLKMLPFVERWSGRISIFLFFYWIYQMNGTKYQQRLQNKARTKFNEQQIKVAEYNSLNPNHQVKISSSWIDYQKYLFAKRNNTLLLSFVLGYVSFNTTSFYENDNDNFFKLLTISTTLFLAGITYIRQLYRE
ncbi:hypothetical protein CKN63_03305 [Carnobacterium divergens]|nr:hypothetical protein CKN59_03265 [Carnobacterium divergens]TFI67887.1 hypothetical protein CKN76_03340 [Carnobacterium divergens]TFI82787.1 hypothetical protein CKN74_03305 [Carnobacterium divergens]TFI93067.1 hypothetical protein CKN61_03205 [Carnobacterium divergens]TFJ08908.1 hypothetical protein CKN75_03335 [Carnobacterium divergens]